MIDYFVKKSKIGALLFIGLSLFMNGLMAMEALEIPFKKDFFGNLVLTVNDENVKSLKDFVEKKAPEEKGKALMVSLSNTMGNLKQGVIDAGFHHHFSDDLTATFIYRNGSPIPYPLTGIGGAFVIIFNKEDKVLLVEDIGRKGRWGLVGGSRDPQELSLNTAIRETLEEVNLTVKAEDLLLIGAWQRIYANFVKANEESRFYLATQYSGEVTLQQSEIIAMAWAPVQELLKEGKFEEKPLNEAYQKIIQHAYQMKNGSTLRKTFVLPDLTEMGKLEKDRDPKKVMHLDLF